MSASPVVTPNLPAIAPLGATSQPLAQIPQPRYIPIIAQQFDQDVLGDLSTVMNNFIESGQVWALIIGFVLGYALRGVTTYK